MSESNRSVATARRRTASIVDVDSTPSYELLLRVRAPFSLVRTVTALRRMPTNIVDVLDGEGVYQRAFETTRGIVVCRVDEVRHHHAVRLRVHGAVTDAVDWGKRVERMLGLNVDLRAFYRAARTDPLLDDLVRRFRGLKPPQYSDLWEAFVNAVPFQQVSLASGIAVVRRLVERLGVQVRCAGTTSYAFPPPTRTAALSPSDWRAFGMSATKSANLRALALAISDGTASEAQLRAMPSERAAAILCDLDGIGPWSAALILLRGMGRLDVFPARDSGVARNLRDVFGFAPGREEERARRLLEELGPNRGMLYYHLLLSRLGAMSDAPQMLRPRAVRGRAPSARPDRAR